jgi:hypothetical protein
MNQANNGYSAFDRSGRSRGPSHSTGAYKQAWRRSTLILRGGPVVRMALYNQGARTDGAFRLRRYPRSATALRQALEDRRFQAG